MISQQNKTALRNPWFLGIIVFLLIGMTGTFTLIYLAFKSPPSLVVDDFYERGEQYLQTQKQLEAEKLLGWTGVFFLPRKVRMAQTHSFELLLQDANALSIKLDSLILYAYRPSDQKADFSVEMIQVSPGKYSADISFPLQGKWDLIAEAHRGSDKFLVNKRLEILP